MEITRASQNAGEKLDAQAIEILRQQKGTPDYAMPRFTRDEYLAALSEAKQAHPAEAKLYEKSLGYEPKPPEPKRYAKVPAEMQNALAELRGASSEEIQAMASRVVDRLAGNTRKNYRQAVADVLKEFPGLGHAYTNGELLENDWQTAARLRGYSDDVLSRIKEKYFGD